jgi:glycosyltransferase involved in cell wall biosynthesis
VNIVYVSYEDTIGRRFNGFDLSQYLTARGDNCAMYVRFHTTNAPFIFDAWPHRLRYRVREKVAGLEQALSLQNILYPPALFYRKHVRIADIVHLHLIGMEYLNFLEFIPLSWTKPIVLSLHEFSSFTGRCPYPFCGCEYWKTGCHSCPDLNGLFPLSSDRTSFLWRYKRFIWKQVKPTIVVGSAWMMNQVSSSPMFTNFEKHLIPFGLDLEIFSPGDKAAARKKLGIPQDSFVILFRALVSPYKGLETIKKALSILNPNRPVSLITINGVGQLDEFIGRYHLVEIDQFRDSSDMARLFNAADLFLMPSTQETFGMMAMEAMACGVPSIVTRHTPLEEVTRAPEAALPISADDHEALAAAIEKMIGNQALRQQMGGKARRLAEELYGFERHARQLRELYGAILQKQKHRG